MEPMTVGLYLSRCYHAIGLHSRNRQTGESTTKVRVIAEA